MKKRILEINLKRVKQGQTYSINTKKHSGHKGNVVKKKHNGTVEVIIFTHASNTRGRANIRLQENPQKGDSAPSYILPTIQKVGVERAGKFHNDMTLKSKTDKSIRRNLQKKSKKRQTIKCLSFRRGDR